MMLVILQRQRQQLLRREPAHGLVVRHDRGGLGGGVRGGGQHQRQAPRGGGGRDEITGLPSLLPAFILASAACSFSFFLTLA